MKTFRSSLWPAVTFLIPATIATFLIVFGSRNGLGVTPDSVNYLSAAETVSSGGGLYTPALDGATALVRFPPLFPLILAVESIGGLEIISAARLLNLLCMLLSLLMLDLTLRDFPLSDSNRFWISMLASTSPALIEVHLMAWSEPLYIFASVALLRRLACDRRRTRFSNVAIAALCSLAALTRYIGMVTFVPAFYAVWKSSEIRGSAMKRIALILIVGGFPIVFWLARAQLFDMSLGDRQIDFYLPALLRLRGIPTTVAGWFIPGLNVGAASVGIAGSIAALTYVARNQPNARAFATICGLYVAIYLTVLVMAALFVDGGIPFNNRILSPLFLPLLMTAAVILAGRERVLTCCLIAFTLAGSWQTTALVSKYSSDPPGYTGARWRHSALMARAMSLPTDATVFSNVPDAVLFLVKRPVRTLPASRYPAVIREAIAPLSDVLDFSGVSWRRYMPGPIDLAAAGFQRIDTTDDGSLWQRPAK